jgi:hypothetical protein
MSTALPRTYGYDIRQFQLFGDSLQPTTSFPTTIDAIEIEMQTNSHWWIYLAADYHNSFYYTLFDSSRAIPTQVTGAVGEAMALVIMEKLYQAANIIRITPHPSSQSADFEMDIIESGQSVHALVESKASNVVLNNPPMQTVSSGLSQLLATRRCRPNSAGYLIITSYPGKACFVIKVF